MRRAIAANGSAAICAFRFRLFENVYDDLKSIEATPVTFIPLHWANTIEGNVYGVEVWASLQAADWWRLSAGGFTSSMWISHSSRAPAGCWACPRRAMIRTIRRRCAPR